MWARQRRLLQRSGAAAVLVAFTAPTVSAAPAAPVAKIVETLSNLQQSMQEEQEVDSAQYRSAFQWCQTAFRDRSQGQNQYQAIEQELKSKQKVREAVNRQLKDEVSQLQQELAEAENAVRQGSSLRQSEHGDYLREQKDSANMLTELNNASDKLNHRALNRQTLLQVASSVQQIAQRSGLVAEKDRVLLDDFVTSTSSSTSSTGGQLAGQQEQQEEQDQQEMNEADAIEETKSSVLQVLKTLTTTFEQSIATAQEQERKALDQYDSLIRMKKQVLLQLQSSKDAKDAALAESEQMIAQLKRSLEDATQVTAASTNHLAEVKKVCADLSTGWAARQAGHQEVLQGLQAVTESLSTAAAASMGGGEQSYGGADAQQNTMLSFLQEGAQSTTKTGSYGGAQEVFAQDQQQPTGTTTLGMVAPPLLGGGGAVQNQGTSSSLGLLNLSSASQTRGGLAAATSASSTSSLPTTTHDSFASVPAEQHQEQMQQDATSSRQATFSSVKRMVEEMMAQIQQATQNEDSHKTWCEAEISRNSGTVEEKGTKLRRILTKVDNEKEALSELDGSLQVLKAEKQNLAASLLEFTKLRQQSKSFFQKSEQNHQVAGQILQQAVAILQRFNALVLEEQDDQRSKQQQQLGFLATGSSSSTQQSASTQQLAQQAVDSLGSLQTKYQQLREQCEKSENTAELDSNSLKKTEESFTAKLEQARTYRSNLELQQRASLDADSEDSTGLKKQKEEVDAYLNRLKSACSDLLQHYDERRARRQANLQALQSARNVINIDNADEIHAQLSRLAGNADAAAMSLVSRSAAAGASSTSSSGFKFTPASAQDSLLFPGADRTAGGATTTVMSKSKLTGSSMLQDLQSLQTMSVGSGQGAVISSQEAARTATSEDGADSHSTSGNYAGDGLQMLPFH